MMDKLDKQVMDRLSPKKKKIYKDYLELQKMYRDEWHCLLLEGDEDIRKKTDYMYQELLKLRKKLGWD
jgi:hypothetical protein